MKKIWNEIVNNLNNSEKEFPTTPKTKKEPVWY